MTSKPSSPRDSPSRTWTRTLAWGVFVGMQWYRPDWSWNPSHVKSHSWFSTSKNIICLSVVSEHMLKLKSFYLVRTGHNKICHTKAQNNTMDKKMINETDGEGSLGKKYLGCQPKSEGRCERGGCGPAQWRNDHRHPVTWSWQQLEMIGYHTPPHSAKSHSMFPMSVGSIKPWGHLWSKIKVHSIPFHPKGVSQNL